MSKTWEDWEEMRQEARQDEALEAIADYEEAQLSAVERDERDAMRERVEAFHRRWEAAGRGYEEARD